jgi:hypothetical protein
MSDSEKYIDLPPHQWRSQDDRPKQREPIFGPGLPGAIAYMVGFIATSSAVYFFFH